MRCLSAGLWCILAIGLTPPALADRPLAAQPTGSREGAWVRVEGMDTGKGTLLERGAAVFQNRCAACHGTPGYSGKSGSDMPGTAALDFKYRGEKPPRLEDRTDLTPEVVKYFVRNGSMYMPQFRKTYVSDIELDALASYLSRKR